MAKTFECRRHGLRQVEDRLLQFPAIRNARRRELQVTLAALLGHVVRGVAEHIADRFEENDINALLGEDRFEEGVQGF